MINITLDDIFDDDSDGLLDIKSKSSHTRTEDERLIESFLEINQFIETQQREPAMDATNIKEHTLAFRLNSIRTDQEKVNKLQTFDEYNLLNLNKSPVESVDDLFEDDDLGLLDSETESIFELSNIPVNERESTDFIARRKPLPNFDRYEPQFKRIHEELSSGTRVTYDYKSEDQLYQGNYYIAGGIIFLLEKVKITRYDHYREDGTRVRRDGRTLCIFENGLYSNMLLRSVGKLLNIDGKIITNPGEDLLTVNSVKEEDKESGYIYVLKSLSTNSQLLQFKNLYKIGFSDTDVLDRIRNSEKESTYLMDKVEVVKVYKCYNLNPHKLEHLLHTFFNEVQLMIDIFDKQGVRHTPREWFDAPLEIIDKAIMMVMSGEIVDYTYDSKRNSITSR